MQKQGGIFQKWFKEFTSAVFTQSLHAVMLGVVLEVVSSINDMQLEEKYEGTQSKDLLISLIIVMGVSAITKFERMVRELFGIGGSALMGDTNSNLMKTKHGIKSAMSVGRRVAEPIKSGVSGLKTRMALKDDPNIKDKLNSGEYKLDKKGYMVRTHESAAQAMAAATAGAGDSGAELDGAEFIPPVNPDSSAGVAQSANASGDGTATDHVIADYQRKIKEYQDAARNAEKAARASSKNPQLKESFLNTANMYKQEASRLQSSLNSRLKPVPAVNNLGNAQTANAPANTSGGAQTSKAAAASNNTDSEPLSERERRKQELEDYKYEKMMKEKDAKEQELVDKYNAAQKQVRSAPMKALFNAGTTLAAIGVGNGAFDELSEVMITADAISKPITKVTSDYVDRTQNRNIQEATINAAVATQQKYNLQDNEIVQKVKISPEFINDPNAASMLSGAIANLKGQTQTQTIDTTVKVNQNIKQEVNQNVERTVKQTVQDNVQQNVDQAIKNIKSTAGRELSSIGLIRKGNYTGNVRGLNHSGSFNTKVDSVSDIN